MGTIWQQVVPAVRCSGTVALLRRCGSAGSVIRDHILRRVVFPVVHARPFDPRPARRVELEHIAGGARDVTGQGPPWPVTSARKSWRHASATSITQRSVG